MARRQDKARFSIAPHGVITHLYANVVQGWAYDPKSLDLSLALEIYVDGACIGLVWANQKEPLTQQKNYFHGFSYAINPIYLKNSRQIAVKIANGGPWLKGTLTLPKNYKSESDIETSYVLANGGLILSGYLAGKKPEIEARKILVFEKGRLVAQGNANLPPPWSDETKQQGARVEIDLPWSLADGKSHLLDVETDKGELLGGSPVSVFALPSGNRCLLESALHKSTLTKNPQYQLLAQHLRRIDNLYPKSVPFSAYAQWYEAFQNISPTNKLTDRVMILILDAGDKDKEALTQRSIKEQNISKDQIKVIKSSTHNLRTILQKNTKDIDFIIPIKCGDRLAKNALSCMIEELKTSKADWGYADCDQDGPDGARGNPWLKPAWDETFYYGADIISPGIILTKKAIERALKLFNPGEKSDWHQLLSRLIITPRQSVLHIPRVLYHRHSSLPVNVEDFLQDHLREKAITWLASQRARDAKVERLPKHAGLLRVIWPLPKKLPLISLLVPTRDRVDLLEKCISSLLDKTHYQNIEIIIIDNDSSCPHTLFYLEEIKKLGVKVLSYPYPFNYAAINNLAVSKAQGEIIGFINNDVFVKELHWLETMLAELYRKNIGAVGAKLLWPNNMVQHGGVVINIEGLAAHAGNRLMRETPGYLATNILAREQSSVTAACLLMRKKDFISCGEFDAQNFPVAFNDVDLCMRIRAAGLSIVWTPFAELFHHESASRGKETTPEKKARSEMEANNFIRLWTANNFVDPFYHPCLSHDYLTGAYGGLSLAPISLKTRKTMIK